MKSIPIFIVAISLVLIAFCYSCKPTQSEQNESSEKMNPQNSAPVDSTLDYGALGQKYVSATQAVLAKNLIEAINKDGAAHALEFCNARAYPLTDSLANALHVGIKRVSDKTRNPNNHANGMELAHIQFLQTVLAKGEKPAPKVTEQNGKMIGYYPIITNAMCLQCHGKTNSDIQPATLQKIQKLYPADMATGYAVNELRGLWVVTMDEQ